MSEAKKVGHLITLDLEAVAKSDGGIIEAGVVGALRSVREYVKREGLAADWATFSLHVELAPFPSTPEGERELIARVKVTAHEPDEDGVIGALRALGLAQHEAQKTARQLLDAPPLAVCDRCGRKTWSPGEVGQLDGMSQPDGGPCDGRLVAT